MSDCGLKEVLSREIKRLGSRQAYLLLMIVTPLAVALFFVLLLGDGLPLRVPNAVVDMDHSAMSRSITRTLDASQSVDIVADAESYSQALDMVQRGDIYGFFIIPDNFENDALAGRQPTLEYFSNMTYFVPGTLTFKGFKTVAVTTSAGMARSTLVSVGMDESQATGMLQPVVIDINAIANPWMNYYIYMSPGFTMATLALVIMLTTVLSITSEIKNATSRQWLKTAGNSMKKALAGKMLPHTVIYFIVSVGILCIFFVWQHIPANGSMWWLILATLLFVVASQCFALFVVCLLPNPRLSFSVVALFGVLCYSLTGFSMPVESMYGALAIFSWLAPVRYWYLTFVCNMLNGYQIYYCRWYFVALLIFVLLPGLLIGRLRKALANPVYVE